MANTLHPTTRHFMFASCMGKDQVLALVPATPAALVSILEDKKVHVQQGRHLIADACMAKAPVSAKTGDQDRCMLHLARLR